jgi:outer membrane immunogenic protein
VKLCVGLLAAVVSLMSASGALAADLYIPQPAPPAPAFSWEGPYVGAKLGGAWGTETDDLSSLVISGGGPVADSFNLSGFNAGVYGGNNWDIDGIIVGLEGSLEYTGLNGSHQFTYEPGDTPFYTGTLSLATDWQAFLKGRLGVPDGRALFYATAGLGLAHATLSVTPDPQDPYTSAVSASNIHLGGLIGAGAEYAFTDRLAGRLEVDFANFGSKPYALGDIFGTVDASWVQATASAGLTFKF